MYRGRLAGHAGSEGRLHPAPGIQPASFLLCILQCGAAMQRVVLLWVRKLRHTGGWGSEFGGCQFSPSISLMVQLIKGFKCQGSS